MDLCYSSSLSDGLVAKLEDAARVTGLPLREVELIGQDPDVARAFVAHVQQGDHLRFLDRLDWTRLETQLRSHAELGGPSSLFGSTPASA